ncbi:MAG: hypothetical protein NT076_03485 [Candidatus Pacearchaeota archaeon]|nr:hypothetical protein [Candidatus Pacearchaeota archaeon]
MKIPKICPKLAEETGWHIGDGSMNFYKQGGKLKGLYQLRGHIEDDREHYVVRVKPLFKELYEIDISLREMPSTRVFGFQVWNNELIEFKQKLGLPLGRKLELKIPEVFFSNRELKEALIRGIFDTDGCLFLEKKNHKLYPRIEIRTISKNLAEDILRLCNDLKFRATKYSEKANELHNRLEIYTIAIRGVEMLHKFFNEISPKNPKHIRKYNQFLNSKSL